MIASMSTDESYILIEKFIATYPDHTIVYIGATSDDMYYATWLQGVYPDIIVYDWSAYSLVQTLSLFQHAQAGI
jgi:ABC-type glycerol-3-phosphate transport system substrate-binding protein